MVLNTPGVSSPLTPPHVPSPEPWLEAAATSVNETGLEATILPSTAQAGLSLGTLCAALESPCPGTKPHRGSPLSCHPPDSEAARVVFE